MGVKMLTLNLSIFGEKYTGMGVYAMHVRQILKHNYDVQEVIANRKLPDINMEKTIFAPYNITTGYSKTASLRRLYYLWQLPHKHELGFVYNPTHHGILGYKNQLITIHDLIAIHYPEQHKMQYWYFKYIVPKLIKECKGIIAVSETTKDDICRYYKVSPDFVYVVPNAMDNNTFIEYKCEDKGFLLCIGVPPLEAMRYGKPIILSDIKIFREIYGDTVIYVTLGNHDSWEKAFQKLHNINETVNLKCKYRGVLDKYSWDSNEEKIQTIIANIALSAK